MKPLILLTLLFVSGNVWACDSYEDCSRWITATDSQISGIMSGDATVIRRDEYGFNLSSGGRVDYAPFISKAIMFKLDEISKKLDDKYITDYYGKKTPCVSHGGAFYAMGTTIPVARSACSSIVNSDSK